MSALRRVGGFSGCVATRAPPPPHRRPRSKPPRRTPARATPHSRRRQRAAATQVDQEVRERRDIRSANRPVSPAPVPRRWQLVSSLSVAWIDWVTCWLSVLGVSSSCTFVVAPPLGILPRHLIDGGARAGPPSWLSALRPTRDRRDTWLWWTHSSGELRQMFSRMGPSTASTISSTDEERRDSGKLKTPGIAPV